MRRAQSTCYSSAMAGHDVMVHPSARVRGQVRPPGDKSISHHCALLAALADGTSTIRGYSTGSSAPDLPSAQVKGPVLLAGSHTSGTPCVIEPLSTRDHTERALHAFESLRA